MSAIKDLMHGEGRLDTALRALALCLFLAVAVALVWTTLSVRRDAAAATFDPAGRDLVHQTIEKEQRP